jgi:hypothetical protein
MMNKSDLLTALRGRPEPFECHGVTVLLRSLTWGERKELLDWYGANEASAEAGMELQRRLILAAVCGADGKPALAPDDLAGVALPIADGIAEEVFRRNGFLRPESAGGKA